MIAYFDGIGCNAYGLTLLSKSISPPEVKKIMVDIPGRDGLLDQTEIFGNVKYNNRSIKMVFEILDHDRSNWPTIESTIVNAIHGQMLNVKFQDDPNYHWVGRCSVEPLEDHNSTAGITISVDTEPYKLKNARTSVTETVVGSALITLTNARKSAVPTITTDAAITVTMGDITETFDAGTYVATEFEIGEGSYIVELDGNATVTFSYQEGVL